MEFKNLIKFYLDEHGRVDKTEDTSFIVSGSENETALEVLIANTETTPTDIVVYASFKRADGFAISNRSLDFKGVTEDSKYYDFLYTFNNDRILDIAGQLEVSFTIKSGTKTINSVSNALYVRRNVKPNLETTTEEEFYQEAIKIVEKAQQDINQHRIESENKFNSKVDKETYEKDMPTKLDKVNNANQVYVTDGSGKQTTMEYSVGTTEKGNAIVVRDEKNRININDPINDTHAVNKRFGDNTYVNKNIVSYSSIKDTIPMRDSEGRLNVGYPKERSHAANRAFVEDELRRIIGLAPEELDTLQELAEAFLAVGIKSIQGVLTEDQVFDLWNTQIDGRYNITSQKYGMEIIIIQHTDGEGKPLFKRMTGGYDYTYDFTLEGWVIASGGGGGGGTGGGGTAGIIQLVSISDLQHTIAKGGELLLEFSFTPSIGTKGTLQIYANGVLKKSQAINKGTSKIDVSSFVNVGTNEITFKVSDTVGNQGALVYLVDVIELTLKSNFNDITAYSGDIEFRYTPNGSGAKNITFKIDGNQYGTIDLVQSSGVQQTKIISGLTHGVHKLEVVSQSLINGNLVSSNKLEYNIIYYVEGNDTILISSKFNTKTAIQGELLSIDYVIYNPTSSTSTVNLLVNGSAVQQNLTQENERKYFFNNTDYPYGNVTFTIDVNGTTKSFVVDVTKVEINVEPITDNLQLYLTAKNRSNTEAESSRNHWVFNDIDTELIDFNWSTNGWLNNTLRFNGKAKATIPFNMFAENFLVNGKTIEFEFATTDVYDLTKVLISCMSGGIGFEITPNTCTIKSTNVTLSTQFKEDKKVRISFVVEKTGELNLVKCLINGVVSGVVEYPTNDIWLQTNPVGISINHNEGSIDIYSIRVYNADLSSQQVLNNYIADMDLTDKIQAYTRNNIIDTITQEVSYAKIKPLIPVLTIVGELPTTKLGDDVAKPIVRVLFEDPINSNNNFEYEGVEINVQGTSSVDFPVKNLKCKFPMKFSFYEGAVPEKTYTFKADYMESSHSHNTGNAIIMNNLSPIFPPQEEDPRVRNAIYGFPIAIFNRKTEDSPLEYIGIYNFNNDKGNSDTIGLTTPSAESWEFKNNISDRCNFKTGDFSSGVSDDFEARYPKDSTNYTNLQRVVSWVASTKNDINKFKNEFEQYFNKEFCLFYYVMMDVILAVDSRSKNMFLDTLDGQIWYPRWYDMDTAYGLDNEGNLAFSYNLEQTDSIDGISVFNGSDSVLWNNFGEAFADDIATYYFNLRSSKKLSYDSLMEVLYGHQISKVSEAMYNTDGQVKYIDIMDPNKVDIVDKTRLYAEQGSRLNHLQWWLNNRFSYLDSKYRYTDYVDDVITMRSYSADNYVVEPSGEFKITPYTSMYLSVTYGRNTAPVIVRGTNNVESSISPSSSVDLKNTETAIYGASKILKLDGIPSKYARTMDFHNATRLKELVVGSGVSGYVNNNLTALTVGNLTRLEKLDVQNCPKLEDTLDLSGCLNIKEIYAKGSSIKGVNLADGGNLQTIELPATVTNLSFINQPFLSIISLAGYTNIKQIRFENVPLINTKNIVSNAINSVDYIRLVGINWTLENTEQNIIDTLSAKGGLSNTGGIVENTPIITGDIYIKGDVANSKLKKWKAKFPEVTFTADNIVYVFYDVIWKDYLGNTIYSVKVESGDSATFPDSEPTRPDDAQYKDYVFTGWLGNDGNQYENTITNISSNLTLTPQFVGTIQKYNVYWYNGDELLEVDEVEYGETAEYNGETPISNEDSSYDFIGWGTTDFVIKGETSFYARFDKPEEITYKVIETYKDPTITLKSTTGSTENINIDWGNGTSQNYEITTSGTTISIPKNNDFCTAKFPPSTNYIISESNSSFSGDYTAITKAHFRYWRVSSPNFFKKQLNITNETFYIGEYSPELNITIIPESIFNGCRNLTSFIIPEWITRIDSSAFANTGLKSIIIPKNVSVVVSAAFRDTPLETIIVDENNKTYDSRNNCNAIIRTKDNVLWIACKNTIIPNTVTETTQSAFNGISGIEYLYIPSSVTKIGNWSFGNMPDTKIIDFSDHVTIPSIGSTEFYNTNCLIVVPDNLYDQWITTTNWSNSAISSKIVKKSEANINAN